MLMTNISNLDVNIPNPEARTDIQLLKVFFTAAQEGSISKAAQKINFAQSNVTHKIR